MSRVGFIVSMLIAALLIVGARTAMGGEGLTILSGGAAKSALGEAIAAYEKTADHRIAAEFAPMGALTKKIEAGARADVLVLSAEAMDLAEAKGWIVPDTRVEIGRVGVGVAVNEMRPHPKSRRRKPSRQRCWQLRA